VAHTVKSRLVRSGNYGLSFYHDSPGNEVDLVVERGRELAVLEIKSGQTVARDSFQWLNRFARDMGRSNPGRGGCLWGQQGTSLIGLGGRPIQELEALSDRAFSLFAD